MKRLLLGLLAVTSIGMSQISMAEDGKTIVMNHAGDAYLFDPSAPNAQYTHARPGEECAGLNGNMPSIFWIHGGGFYAGSAYSPEDSKWLSSLLGIGNIIKIGYLNYSDAETEDRMGEFTLPKILDSVEKHITNCIKSTPDNDNSQKRYIIGHSSGGYLALMTSLNKYAITENPEHLFDKAIIYSGITNIDAWVRDIYQTVMNQKSEEGTSAEPIVCGPSSSIEKNAFCAITRIIANAEFEFGYADGNTSISKIMEQIEGVDASNNPNPDTDQNDPAKILESLDKDGLKTEFLFIHADKDKASQITTQILPFHESFKRHDVLSVQPESKKHTNLLVINSEKHGFFRLNNSYDFSDIGGILGTCREWNNGNKDACFQKLVTSIDTCNNTSSENCPSAILTNIAVRCFLDKPEYCDLLGKYRALIGKNTPNDISAHSLENKIKSYNIIQAPSCNIISAGYRGIKAKAESNFTAKGNDDHCQKPDLEDCTSIVKVKFKIHDSFLYPLDFPSIPLDDDIMSITAEYYTGGENTSTINMAYTTVPGGIIATYPNPYINTKLSQADIENKTYKTFREGEREGEIEGTIETYHELLTFTDYEELSFPDTVSPNPIQGGTFFSQTTTVDDDDIAHSFWDTALWSTLDPLNSNDLNDLPETGTISRTSEESEEIEWTVGANGGYSPGRFTHEKVDYLDCENPLVTDVVGPQLVTTYDLDNWSGWNAGYIWTAAKTFTALPENDLDTYRAVTNDSLTIKGVVSESNEGASVLLVSDRFPVTPGQDGRYRLVTSAIIKSVNTVGESFNVPPQLNIYQFKSNDTDEADIDICDKLREAMQCTASNDDCPSLDALFDEEVFNINEGISMPYGELTMIDNEGIQTPYGELVIVDDEWRLAQREVGLSNESCIQIGITVPLGNPNNIPSIEVDSLQILRMPNIISTLSSNLRSATAPQTFKSLHTSSASLAQTSSASNETPSLLAAFEQERYLKSQENNGDDGNSGNGGSDSSDSIKEEITYMPGMTLDFLKSVDSGNTGSGNAGSKPIVIWVHGGYWHSGSKDEGVEDDYIDALVNKAYVFKIDYQQLDVNQADVTNQTGYKTYKPVWSIYKAVTKAKALLVDYTDADLDEVYLIGADAGATAAVLSTFSLGYQLDVKKVVLYDAITDLEAFSRYHSDADINSDTALAARALVNAKNHDSSSLSHDLMTRLNYGYFKKYIHGSPTAGVPPVEFLLVQGTGNPEVSVGEQHLPFYNKALNINDTGKQLEISAYRLQTHQAGVYRTSQGDVAEAVSAKTRHFLFNQSYDNATYEHLVLPNPAPILVYLEYLSGSGGQMKTGKISHEFAQGTQFVGHVYNTVKSQIDTNEIAACTETVACDGSDLLACCQANQVTTASCLNSNSAWTVMPDGAWVFNDAKDAWVKAPKTVNPGAVPAMNGYWTFDNSLPPGTPYLSNRACRTH